ncbi:PQQ-binding-like beta-propeller repeat protein [Krasilnikovia cinnamomea]|uniref:outer membrane protein assembly factor BamB family protein n=1 Tax=Krasilnikovia cinnamomea TaxID=349313 RepID=UPI00102CF95B|nr:PQQ-binding-like beta-propeller repeat protein [Krasilnikovia cinnamomea]
MKRSGARPRWSAAVVAVAVAALITSPPAMGAGQRPGAGHQLANATAWAQDGFNAANTSYNANESIINAATIRKVTRRWRITVPAFPSDCPTAQAPVVAGGRVFLVDDGGVAAFRVGDGRLLWRWNRPVAEPPGRVHLAVVGGALVVGVAHCGSVSDPTGSLSAFDVGTGTVRWSRSLPVGSLVTDQGLVVVSDTSASEHPEGIVRAYRVTDGVQVWSREGVANRSNVSAKGRLLLSRYAGGTVCVATSTGAVLWERAQPYEGVLAASPAGDRFFVVDFDRVLRAVNAGTGATLWSRPGVDIHFGNDTVATDGRRLFVAVGLTLTAYRADTGAVSWTRTLNGGVGQPIRAGGLVYTVVSADTGSSLAILQAASGAPAVKGTAYRGAVDHPVIVNGRLYLRQSGALSLYRP